MIRKILRKDGGYQRQSKGARQVPTVRRVRGGLRLWALKNWNRLGSDTNDH